MPQPTHFKNPFVKTAEVQYRCYDIWNKLTYNDLNIIPLQWIHIREPIPDQPWTKIKEHRIIACDTRYPIVIFESRLDPENINNKVKKRYCIFDGNHRATKLLREGKTSAVCFILHPHVFDGLKEYDRQHLGISSLYRTTSCVNCEE